MQYDELAVVLRLIKGDENAFECIYHRHSKKIYGQLLRLVKIETIAQELLQDVFIKLWDNKNNLDSTENIGAYLSTIAQHKAIDFFRAAARNKKLENQLILAANESYVHVEESCIAREQHEKLDSIVRMLPSKRRSVYELVKIEGKTYEEVTEQLKISRPTINDHIVKATRYIKSKFDYKQIGVGALLLFYILRH